MAIIMSESARKRMGIAAPKVARYVPPKVEAAAPLPPVKRAKPVDPRKGRVDSCGNRCFPIPLSARLAAGKMPRNFRDLSTGTTPDLSTPSGVRSKANSMPLGTDVYHYVNREGASSEVLTEL